MRELVVDDQYSLRVEAAVAMTLVTSLVSILFVFDIFPFAIFPFDIFVIRYLFFDIFPFRYFSFRHFSFRPNYGTPAESCFHILVSYFLLLVDTIPIPTICVDSTLDQRLCYRKYDNDRNVRQFDSGVTC